MGAIPEVLIEGLLVDQPIADQSRGTGSLAPICTARYSTNRSAQGSGPDRGGRIRLQAIKGLAPSSEASGGR